MLDSTLRTTLNGSGPCTDGWMTVESKKKNKHGRSLKLSVGEQRKENFFFYEDVQGAINLATDKLVEYTSSEVNS